MLNIKNDQTLLSYHFNKIIKEPGIVFQSLTSSKKHLKNVCHIAQ